MTNGRPSPEDAAGRGCSLAIGLCLLAVGIVVALGGLLLSTWSLFGQQPVDPIAGIPGAVLILIGVVVLLVRARPGPSPIVIGCVATAFVVAGIVAAVTNVHATAALDTGASDPHSWFGANLWHEYGVSCGSVVNPRGGLGAVGGGPYTTEQRVCSDALDRRRAWAFLAFAAGFVGLVVAAWMWRSPDLRNLRDRRVAGHVGR